MYFLRFTYLWKFNSHPSQKIIHNPKEDYEINSKFTFSIKCNYLNCIILK